ncbi:MAG: phosphoribosylanthranilate isomerase [Lachnospiraceae bacterium]|nr:phosphoribosylanthranilate isomerase [Lachnospiraceae bacterium]
MGRIKICGLRRKEDIQYVNECRPDYAGFVFAPSRRQISLVEAIGLRQMLHPDIPAVGVYVNQPVSDIMDCVIEGAVDWIQLHGDETEATIQEIKCAADVPIVKAVRVRNEADIRRADALSCDYLLFDTYSEQSYGGTGKSFAWEMIPADLKHPYFLAGGIDENNIQPAMETGCYAVDVSGGVETDGFKDRDKIKRLVEAVHGN